MAFNWDCLDIGNIELEHSQNYFDNRHLEHERLNEQSDDFINKIVPRSKPIAIFKGKRLFKSEEFQQEVDQPKEQVKKQKVAVKEVPLVIIKSKVKPTIAPVTKKDSIKSVKAPTVARSSRLTQYAETYAERRKAMIERYKKEQEEKNKPKRFRARSLPRYLKAQKAQKRILNEENKENVKDDNLPNKRPNLRTSRSALELK